MMIDPKRVLGVLAVTLVAACSAPSKVRQSNNESQTATPASQRANAATPSVVASPTQTNDSPGFALSKRFVKSWNAGRVMRAGMESAMNKMRTDQPGAAELARRVAEEIGNDELEDVAARVYARHLSVETLSSLLGFTETPTGKHFFDLVMSAVIAGKNPDQTMMRDFTADELVLIMKFSQSDYFAAMQAALPAINKEMAEAGRAFGQKKMREYVQRH